jgi:hypothetical protein
MEIFSTKNINKYSIYLCVLSCFKEYIETGPVAIYIICDFYFEIIIIKTKLQMVNIFIYIYVYIKIHLIQQENV